MQCHDADLRFCMDESVTFFDVVQLPVDGSVTLFVDGLWIYLDGSVTFFDGCLRSNTCTVQSHLLTTL